MDTCQAPGYGSVAVYIPGIIQSDLHWALCDQSSAQVCFSYLRPLPSLCMGLSLSAVQEHKP